MIGSRDLEYIDNRLIAPAPEALEAHGRLAQVRENDLAGRLMEALQQFSDECRAIRRELHARQREVVH